MNPLMSIMHRPMPIIHISILPDTKIFETSYLIEDTKIVGYVPNLGPEMAFRVTFQDPVAL